MLGIHRPEAFLEFAGRIDCLKNSLLEQLHKLKSQGCSIAGYGASHSVTTIIHQLCLGDQLDFLVDDNPAKYNTLSPGYKIPVLPSSALYEKHPDYVVVLAWRYLEPIAIKHQKYLNQGGHFICPLPTIKII